MDKVWEVDAIALIILAELDFTDCAMALTRLDF